MEESMYPYGMKIDGIRADDDQRWRIERIHRVLGYAQALADLDDCEGFYQKIKSIWDDKGTLFVDWITEPTDKEKEYLRKAWESIVTDYETNTIKHDVLSK